MKKGVAIGIGCGVLFLIFLGCAGIFGGLAWFGIGMYKDTTKAADSFLSQLGNGDINGAYQAGSSALRQEQTLEQFTASAKALRLTEYQSAQWTGFNVVNNQGTIDGTMTTKAGTAIPLKVSLIKEDGIWRVAGVTSSAPGIANPAANKPMPTDDELKKLAQTSLLDFNQGVQAGDFTAFYGTFSELWKREIKPDAIQDVFKEFVEKKINIANIKDSAPVFNQKPAIDPNGFLVLEGYYPTKPLRVNFTLKYTYEHPHWKLAGIHVKTGE